MKTPRQSGLILPNSNVPDIGAQQNFAEIERWAGKLPFPIQWHSRLLSVNYDIQASAGNVNNPWPINVVGVPSFNNIMSFYKQEDWTWLALTGGAQVFRRFETAGNEASIMSWALYLRPAGNTTLPNAPGHLIGQASASREGTPSVYTRFTVGFQSGPIKSLNRNNTAINGIWLPAGKYEVAIKTYTNWVAGATYTYGALPDEDPMWFTITEYPPPPSLGI